MCSALHHSPFCRLVSPVKSYNSFRSLALAFPLKLPSDMLLLFKHNLCAYLKSQLCSNKAHPIWITASAGYGSISIGKIRRSHSIALTNEPIVISGISGRFPNASNMREFQLKLLNGFDFLGPQDRWDTEKLPKRFGSVADWAKFDASFFQVIPKLADMMDPQQRKLLEVTFEAIIDAGLNPADLRGTRTGVYVGAYGGDTNEYHAVNGFLEKSKMFHVFTIPGYMLANRLSYAFDLKGTSLKVDVACSSSIHALEQAVSAIRLGTCDSALVAGSTIYLSPDAFENTHLMGALSPDGIPKVFDSQADGYVRSEGVFVILLQKESAAKRCYATIRHIESNANGANPAGIMHPSTKSQIDLFQSVYKRAGVSPLEVTYVEAHGTGTQVGDPAEIAAINKVFCEDPKRSAPLYVGTIKSSMGHCEHSSALAGLANVLTVIQTGTIPANLHLNEPNDTLKQLQGSIKVAERNIEWTPGLIGLSSYGVGGTNAHMILEPGRIQSPPTITSLPLLIPFTGRTQEGTENSLQDASILAAENTHVAHLLQNTFRQAIPGHGYRGYAIVNSEDGENAAINVTSTISEGKRPLWYIFPGMGSQWEGMGKEMMKFEPFAESIMASERCLKSTGINLTELVLTDSCTSLFSDIRCAMLAIASVQIALYELLTAIGLQPEGYVGHSTGEIICAYADGCITREEAILTTDARGRAFNERAKNSGSMATIGMSWNSILQRLPLKVQAACNNSPMNVTISGDKDAVADLIKSLIAEGLFAREVNSCGIAAHSNLVEGASALSIEYLKDIMPVRKARSSKWISTSIPEAQWDTELAMYNSPEYHGNNVLQPVLFYDALQHVPEKAIVIEVSPKGFFQGLLKEALPTCTHIAPMTAKNNEDKIGFCLNSIGQIHNSGVDVNMGKLYPEASFPVPANTPCLSPLVNWNHEASWNTFQVTNPRRPGKVFLFDVSDDSDAYLSGHKVSDKVLFPAAGYLTLAWIGLAECLGKHPENLPVTLENVNFEQATFLQEKSPVMLKFSVMDQTGGFIITSGDKVEVKGCIRRADDSVDECEFSQFGNQKQGSQVQIEWTGNWTTFLDTLFQTTMLQVPRNKVAVPRRLQSLTIYPQKLLKYVNESNLVPANYESYTKTIYCPGVEIKGLTSKIIESMERTQGHQILKKQKFIPYQCTSGTSSIEEILSMFIDIIIQQTKATDIKVEELCANATQVVSGRYLDGVDIEGSIMPNITVTTLASSLKSPETSDYFKTLGIQLNLVESESDLTLKKDSADLVILAGLESQLPSVANRLKDGAFIISSQVAGSSVSASGLKTIATFLADDSELFYLYQKKQQGSEISLELVQINIEEPNFGWLAALQREMACEASPNRRIYLTSQKNPNSGLIGLMKSLRKQPGGEALRGILDPASILNLNFIKPDAELAKVIHSDLAINVIKNGLWGTYCCEPFVGGDENLDAANKECKEAFVDILKTGDLSSLRWIESPLNCNTPKNLDPLRKFVKVAYSAINFSDVMIASGMLPIETDDSEDCMLGLEFAGYDAEGKRVMGVDFNYGGIATSILAPADSLYEVPDSWSLEDAATVPFVYATAYYALLERGRLEPGQTILIHSGAGGVGQAAIRVALRHGLKVFTTVGADEKRNFLNSIFPEIPDHHILSSRDCSFESKILKATKGRGVDAVLNSLADEKFPASVRCLAGFGKFLEVGSMHTDSVGDNSQISNIVSNNIEFHGIKLLNLYRDSPQGKKILRDLLQKGIESGVVKPLPRSVFKRESVQEAFRFMASGLHTGKVLIDVGEEREHKTGLLLAIPRAYFNPEKVYIVVGGMEGLGLETVDWMVERGARHLVLPSRSGVTTTDYQASCIQRWTNKGAVVEAPNIDLASFHAAEDVVIRLVRTKEIGGIFNSAVVTRDNWIQNLSTEDLKAASTYKVELAKNLDILTRKHCPGLDFFVVYSSVVCDLGYQQQSIYGYASSALERICENRRADGLHGLAIQWGAISDVGYFEYKHTNSADYGENIRDLREQSIASCLKVLDRFLYTKESIITSFLFAKEGNKLQEQQQQGLGLMVKVMDIFGIADVNTLSETTKLTDLGMDSLIASQLSGILEADYEISITPTQLRSITIQDLRSLDRRS